MTTTQIRDDAVLFLDGDAVLARYEVRPRTAPIESPRPYVHPLRTRTGREVTLLRPDDHVWHQGLSLALPNAGPHNFWGGPRSFEGGRALTPGGLVDADAQRGGTAPWMGLVGDGATVVMAGLDRDPQWFARSEEYAGLCPAPFFDEELALADGAILELRCDLVIADGGLDPSRAARLVEAARFA